MFSAQSASEEEEEKEEEEEEEALDEARERRHSAARSSTSASTITLQLIATDREKAGRLSANKARKEGLIPCAVFKHGENRNDESSVRGERERGGKTFAKVYEIRFEDETYRYRSGRWETDRESDSAANTNACI